MFVLFEGIDGSGKTTLIKAVEAKLKSMNIDVATTSELGRTEEWSVQGRKALMSTDNLHEQYETILKVRTAHNEEVLKNLDPETVLLMDRYLPSTTAYQRCEGLPASTIVLEHFQNKFPAPAMTFLLTVNPETSQRRISSRGNKDVFDGKPLSHFVQLDERLKAAMNTFNILLGWKYTTLDGEKSVDGLVEICVDTITENLRKGYK